MQNIFAVFLLIYAALVNHYEIDYIHKIFTKLLTPDNPTFINSSALITLIHTTNIEIVKHFFSLYPDKKLTWDFFFQFTIITTCTSTASLFYYVEYNRISWDNVRQASLVLKTVADCGSAYKQEFDRCDLNNDGYLTFQQFILLVSKNKTVWDPICQFRKLMLEYTVHLDQAVLILERRLKLPEIKLYQKYHNNQLPKLTCSKQLHLLFSSEPHPFLYNFDYVNEINTNCSGNKLILVNGEELSLESLIMSTLYYLRPSTSVYRLVFNTDSISRILTSQCDDIDLYYMSRTKRIPLNDSNNNNNNNNNNNGATTTGNKTRSNSISKAAVVQQQRLSLKEGDMIKKNSILRRSTITTPLSIHRSSATPGQLPMSVERTRASGYYMPSNLASRQTSMTQSGLLSRQTSNQPVSNIAVSPTTNNMDVSKKVIVPPLIQINNVNYGKGNNGITTPHLVSPTATRIVVSPRMNNQNI